MVLILFILPYSLTFHIVAFPLSCFETRFESTNLLIGHIFRALSFHFIGSMFKYFKNTWNSFWICFVLTIRIQSSSCFVLWMWLFPCGSMESIAGLQKWSGEIKVPFLLLPQFSEVQKMQTVQSPEEVDIGLFPSGTRWTRN